MPQGQVVRLQVSLDLSYASLQTADDGSYQVWGLVQEVRRRQGLLLC